MKLITDSMLGLTRALPQLQGALEHLKLDLDLKLDSTGLLVYFEFASEKNPYPDFIIF